MIVPPLRDELHQIETKIKTLLPEIDCCSGGLRESCATPVIPHHHRRIRTFTKNLTRPARLLL
jgi:hypothetical protein